MHYSSYLGKLDKVRNLLIKGADINEQTTKFKRTALIIACINKRYNIAKYLIDQKCDINILDIKGKDAKYYAGLNKDWNLNYLFN